MTLHEYSFLRLNFSKQLECVCLSVPPYCHIYFSSSLNFTVYFVLCRRLTVKSKLTCQAESDLVDISDLYLWYMLELILSEIYVPKWNLTLHISSNKTILQPENSYPLKCVTDCIFHRGFVNKNQPLKVRGENVEFYVKLKFLSEFK